MKLDADDFELFGLGRAFELDDQRLDAHWRALQGEVHPDRFAAEGASAQRIALQWAVRVNEAFQRLKDPLRRAAYLCELAGHPIEAESNTSMPGTFLMQQMEWREALDQASSLPMVEVLAEQVDSERNAALDKIRSLIDARRDYAEAARQVRALMFVERFAADVDRRLEALGQ